MNISIKHRFLSPSPGIASAVGKILAGVTPRAKIEKANVIIEKNGRQSPPFRVAASLAVPGPDIHAEVREHTLGAALAKLQASLDRMVEERVRRQVSKRREQRHLRAVPA